VEVLFACQKNDLRATSGRGQSFPESQHHETTRNWERFYVALSLFPQPARDPLAQEGFHEHKCGWTVGVGIQPAYATTVDTSSAGFFAGASAIRATPIGMNIAVPVSRPLRSLAGWIAMSAITVA